ncbi:MAG: DUF1338 domain-containing protein [Flavobacteriaceae bacterium TMED116]|nr:MAG: DUF1338 domain-containing protein [Flavobacteriaceae bacterium TMED116]|tara:strand:+ start:2722 stop:3627 length:906 start_codon:yes stop_codon:yes gene_type:complete
MKFKVKTVITEILESLFLVYSKRVPDVNKITTAMIKKGLVNNQNEIVNDHIAFRTMGVKYLGINSFEKIFLKHGYKKMDFYHFDAKKLDAFWYAPPSNDLPRIFISELKVDNLSIKAQEIIKSYTNTVTNDPVDKIDLNNSLQVSEYLQTPLWRLPTKNDYESLLFESEYAAWVIYNRYYLNHYTISVHDLPGEYSDLNQFNEFVKSLGIKLNKSGGEIKVSKDKLLRQSSSVANQIEAKFSEGEKKLIAGSYVEFAERNILPEFSKINNLKIERKHRREGFETGNADKIFESTFTSQINN